MLTPALLKEIARKVRGPFAEEYKILLETAADPRGLDDPWAIPTPFLEAGLASLVERELGRDARPFAEKILALWRQPEWQKPGLAHHFGWQGLLYDWIYDAMTPEERTRFGELLGEWVATWWKTPKVYIARAGWWYNQHWGPSHLDEMHNRVALAAKLFIDLGVAGNAGRFEDAVQTNLKTFQEKFRKDGFPALEEMGGIWSESAGHGSYGPLETVPYSLEAILTGFGFDSFAAGTPTGFAREYIRAAIFSMMPHNNKMAYIDDSGSGYPAMQARVAPLMARHFRDGVARWLSDIALHNRWLRAKYMQQAEVWQRIAFLPEDVKPVNPKEAGWPLAYHFEGAGHVYMRSAWEDPAATWAFFGAGPSYSAHSRDDEGHFLITKRGSIANRSGGAGHNDDCYYTGGSLIFNIVTIYHPEEKMRRSAHNENDGGLLRYVYTHNFPVDRGHITGHWHDDNLATYTGADLTKAYWSEKAREVTRQFLYLRGSPECFVIFDRVESTSADYPKIWFLHLPGEPSVTGTARVKVADHVIEYDGDTAAWTSDPAGDTGMLVSGASRVLLRRLAPAPARITKRGGQGHDFWGNPYNPAAQYNHTLDSEGKDRREYRRPPLSPWRLEVEPSARQPRDCFLHLLYVSDEGAPAIVPAERIDQPGKIGARIPLGERTVTVMFNESGPVSGRLSIVEGGKTLHDADLPFETGRRPLSPVTDYDDYSGR